MGALATRAEIGEPTSVGHLSVVGRERLLAVPAEPLFVADWERVLFIHYEVDAAALRKEVPFEIDLWQGRALVSLVAFNMRDLRPRRGGRITAWPFKPICTHPFLNVRTYVKHEGERAIFFITEWLPNRLSVLLGPLFYGLPYRLANLDYAHIHESSRLEGRVSSPGGRGEFRYEAQLPPHHPFEPCHARSRDEFLLERYTAYTAHGRTRRVFRIWHPSWPQVSAQVSIAMDTLLTETRPWFKDARLAGANYSPGFRDVWMGRAFRVE